MGNKRSDRNTRHQTIQCKSRSLARQASTYMKAIV